MEGRCAQGKKIPGSSGGIRDVDRDRHGSGGAHRAGGCCADRERVHRHAGDLSFILKQIKIAERHARALAGTDAVVPANPNTAGDPDYCQALLDPDADQIPDILTSYGLRTVDGSCNNLKTGNFAPGVPNAKVAAADQPFPRLTTPVFRDAEPITPSFPVGAPGPTSYKQKTRQRSSTRSRG